jgi:hypothetical protein
VFKLLRYYQCYDGGLHELDRRNGEIVPGIDNIKGKGLSNYFPSDPNRE